MRTKSNISERAFLKVTFNETNLLDNAMDKLSEVMLKMTDHCRNYCKPCRPPFTPYMTGMR